MNSFGIWEAVRFGGQKAREHAGFLALAILTWIGVLAVEGVARKLIGTWPAQIASIVVINPLLTLGFNRCVLDMLDNAKPRIPRLFSQGHLLLNYWGMALIGLVVLGCILGLVIAAAFGLGLTAVLAPDMLHNWKLILLAGLSVTALGILLAARLCFVQWALVDLSSGPVQCYRESLRISKGQGWHLILFFLALILLNLVGLLCLLVGVIATGIISILAIAHVYRLLLQAAEAPASAA